MNETITANLTTLTTLPQSKIPWDNYLPVLDAIQVLIIIFGTTGNVVSFVVLQSKRFKVEREKKAGSWEITFVMD